MDTLRAIKKRDAAIGRLRDLYSSAESFGFTSATINERFSAINADLYKCPSWVREYVSGYRRCLDDMLYRYKLVHGGFYAEKFYSTHSNRYDYYGSNGIDAVDYADNGRVTLRGHYWIKHVDKGNPKPFFTMENDR
jgi:hypothetical protein